ncbi:MAG TPA: hypothetical protein V6C81_11245 [Planktothrix sp.]|jgi:hypothetical protein
MFDSLANAWHKADTTEKVEICAVGAALLAATGGYLCRGAISEMAPQLFAKFGETEQPARGLLQEEGLFLSRTPTSVSNPDLLAGIRDTANSKVLGGPGKPLLDATGKTLLARGAEEERAVLLSETPTDVANPDLLAQIRGTAGKKELVTTAIGLGEASGKFLSARGPIEQTAVLLERTPADVSNPELLVGIRDRVTEAGQAHDLGRTVSNPNLLEEIRSGRVAHLPSVDEIIARHRSTVTAADGKPLNNLPLSMRIMDRLV